MDVNIHRAVSTFQKYDADFYTDDAELIISDPAIDLIYIASNHATHAEYAIRALEEGKSVHIEKPHAVSVDQLRRLCAAMDRSRGKVWLGFNRPHSRIGRQIRQHLHSQSGAAMYNWFVAGHQIDPDHWYFRNEEGGRVLGNLCHWTDFVYQMVPAEARYPITIRPTRAHSSDCDIAVTYVFGDESIAAITFSAKGHTFEGVREKFSAHRGDVLISMDDFQKLVVEVADVKHTLTLMHRDHGHEVSIKNSYQMLGRTGEASPGCSVSYVWETGDLFLKTREALEQNVSVELQPYRSHLDGHDTVGGKVGT
jgi:predicted dehydrogenase